MRQEAIVGSSPVVLRVGHSGAHGKTTYEKARRLIQKEEVELGRTPYVSNPNCFILRINNGHRGWAVSCSSYASVIESLYPGLVADMDREQTYLLLRSQGKSHETAKAACCVPEIREYNLRLMRRQQLVGQSEEEEGAEDAPDLAQLIADVKACSKTSMEALRELPITTPVTLQLPGLNLQASTTVGWLLRELNDSVAIGPKPHLDQRKRYMQHPLAVPLDLAVGQQQALLVIPVPLYRSALAGGQLPNLDATVMDYLVMKALGKSDEVYKQRAAKQPPSKKLVSYDFVNLMNRSLASYQRRLEQDPNDAVAQQAVKSLTERLEASKHKDLCAAALEPASEKQPAAAEPTQEPAAVSRPTKVRQGVLDTLRRIRNFFCQRTDRCPAPVQTGCPEGVCPLRKKATQERLQAAMEDIAAALPIGSSCDTEDHLQLCTSLCRAALTAADECTRIAVPIKSASRTRLRSVESHLRDRKMELEQLRSQARKYQLMLQARGAPLPTEPDTTALPDIGSFVPQSELEPMSKEQVEELVQQRKSLESTWKAFLKRYKTYLKQLMQRMRAEGIRFVGNPHSLTAAAGGFKQLMTQHIQLTVAAAEAVLSGNEDSINKRVNKLMRQIRSWVQTMEALYGDASASLWEDLLSKHTLLAKDLLVANVSRPENYEAKRDEALKGLKRNGSEIKEFLAELPDGDPMQLRLAQHMWDAHLSCTASYSALLGETAAVENSDYKKAVQDCLQKGELFGYALDTLQSRGRSLDSLLRVKLMEWAAADLLTPKIQQRVNALMELLRRKAAAEEQLMQAAAELTVALPKRDSQLQIKWQRAIRALQAFRQQQESEVAKEELEEAVLQLANALQ